MRVGQVRSIFRYPVKSMGGESLEQSNVGVNGLPGDRAWAVRDEERGGIRGGKRFAGLMQCSARYLQEPAAPGSMPAEITLPCGTRIMSGDPAVSGAISEALGARVTLWPLMPAEMLDHYRRGLPENEDMLEELRMVFGRAPGEPLPDISAFPPELFEFESPPGTYFDAFPLLLLTSNALATMQRKTPESRFDVRRFRPNFYIDSESGEDFPELGWLGRRVRIGGVEIENAMACPRCVMTTHGFDDLPKDAGVMRALVRDAEGNMGVYAKVIAPGIVRAGDTVEVL